MGRSLTSDGFNLKLHKEGSGSGEVPARTGIDIQYDHIAIAHGYGSDELIWQVAITTSGSETYYFSPILTNGSFLVDAYIDDTYFYIDVADASVVSESAIPFTYEYRLLIP